MRFSHGAIVAFVLHRPLHCGSWLSVCVSVSLFLRLSLSLCVPVSVFCHRVSVFCFLLLFFSLSLSRPFVRHQVSLQLLSVRRLLVPLLDPLIDMFFALVNLSPSLLPPGFLTYLSSFKGTKRLLVCPLRLRGPLDACRVCIFHRSSCVSGCSCHRHQIQALSVLCRRGLSSSKLAGGRKMYLVRRVPA